MNKIKTGMSGLMLGALGVVFGDIGTSPLYAVQAVFSPKGLHLDINQTNIYGIISMIFWTVTLVVSIKYIGFIMKADNEGEGGIIALVAKIKSSTLGNRSKWFYIMMGLVGVSLFYGDSAITPAISVLSAVEGIRVVFPSMSTFILPITVIIITFLFGIQRFGTNLIGKLFGPIMLIWFLVIGGGGIWQIWKYPEILKSLSPLSTISFFTSQPLIAFIAVGAVILTVTGAEALYADMGHFGRKPIARAWFFLVFPALILCYLGQGALILNNPQYTANVFILMFPESVRFVILPLATLATLIASQAVITGAFSLTRQAVQLGFLPKMTIRHTSTKKVGQIFLPFVNISLFIAVLFLILAFGSSEKLAHAYGIAVSGTLAIDTILFIVVTRIIWKKPIPYLMLYVVGFLLIDILFVVANLSKIIHGGWFPILLAIITFTILYTWIKGQQIITKSRKKLEGNLQDYINVINRHKPPITRLPGQAVYIAHHEGLAPLALHASIEELHELNEKVVIVIVKITNEAHVPENQRAIFNNLELEDGISQLILTYGFHDVINIPKTLKSLRHLNKELDFDPMQASYFVSLSKVILTRKHNMSGWRKSLYSVMARNALSVSDFYKLPVDRTIEMHSLIEL